MHRGPCKQPCAPPTRKVNACVYFMVRFLDTLVCTNASVCAQESKGLQRHGGGVPAGLCRVSATYLDLRGRHSRPSIPVRVCDLSQLCANSGWEGPSRYRAHSLFSNVLCISWMNGGVAVHASASQNRTKFEQECMKSKPTTERCNTTRTPAKTGPPSPTQRCQSAVCSGHVWRVWSIGCTAESYRIEAIACGFQLDAFTAALSLCEFVASCARVAACVLCYQKLGGL